MNRADTTLPCPHGVDIPVGRGQGLCQAFLKKGTGGHLIDQELSVTEASASPSLVAGVSLPGLPD